MEEIIKQIEAEFAPAMEEASNALSVAQMNFNNLVGTKDEKIRAIRTYYEALAQRDQAQAIIDATNPAVVQEVSAKLSDIIK